MPPQLRDKNDPGLLAMNGAGGCVLQAHAGWTFVFVTFGIVSLYILIGTLYSTKGPRQLPLGIEALPHLEF